MQYINIKKTELSVSRLCMGGCPMGGYGWGKVSENELIASVKAAVDDGVNFFDTADTYGLGQSEITLSKALADSRKNVVICDKFGVNAAAGRKTFYDNSREYIISACEASLKRLNTDYIDIYTIHYRDGKTPLCDVVETLLMLKKQGKIRYFGLSNIYDSDMSEIEEFSDYFVTFQDEYSLACRKNEDFILKFKDKCAVTPMTWGSLGQGILTGKYNADNVNFSDNDRRSRDVYVNFHGEKLKKNLAVVNVMREIAKNYGVGVSSVAIAYILKKIPDSVVIAGIKRPSQLKSNEEAFDFSLSDGDLALLDKISN